MKQWLNKTVGFKRDDPDDVELYEFSKTLPNFTALVKRYLRQLMEGKPVSPWVDVQTEVAPSQEITGTDIRTNEGQFLL